MAQQRRSVLIHSKINDQLERITTLLGSTVIPLDHVQKTGDNEIKELTRLKNNSEWYMHHIKETAVDPDKRDEYIASLKEIKSNFEAWGRDIHALREQNTKDLAKYGDSSGAIHKRVKRIDKELDTFLEISKPNIEIITNFINEIEKMGMNQSDSMNHTPRPRVNNRPDGWMDPARV